MIEPTEVPISTKITGHNVDLSINVSGNDFPLSSTGRSEIVCSTHGWRVLKIDDPLYKYSLSLTLVRIRKRRSILFAHPSEEAE